MAASVYLGHFSAPGFYHSLRRSGDDVSANADSSATPSELRDYFKVALCGFGSVTLLNCLVLAFGFLTFGANSNGSILKQFFNTGSLGIVLSLAHGSLHHRRIPIFDICLPRRNPRDLETHDPEKTVKMN
jgi:hypothetical protein